MMDDSEDDEAPMLVPLRDDGPVGDASEGPLMISATEEDKSPLPPCPVTILSGFLGSGKTTLIQHILKSRDHRKRIAVIENEFGEGLAIETLIAKDGVDNSSLSDFIELPNGCVCCTVKDSLVETLENLLEKRTDLDYILIEASGMANPGPIASVFWLDDALESRLRLDGVVTLVDAYHITQQLTETQEASQQVAYADRLLLNKIDLLPDDSAIAAVHATLQQINPTAPIRNTTYSQVPDLDWILDANCYDERYSARSLEQTVETLLDGDEHEHHHDSEHNHSHEHDHGHSTCATCQQQEQLHHNHNQNKEQDEHSHTSAVTTLGFREKGTMDLEKLHGWLALILWPNQDEKEEVLRKRLEEQLQGQTTSIGKSVQQQQQIFRVKGVVSICSNQEKADEHEWELYCDKRTGIDQRRYIVQAVYDTWEIHPSKEIFGQEEERECKLVVIGRFLQRNELLQGFQFCLV